jgi:gluconate 2-dehydrogenase alpha chain
VAPDSRRPLGWGGQWKEETAKWYGCAINIAASGSVMLYRGNYLDLDPTYRNRFGMPQTHMTLDYKDNQRKISARATKAISTRSRWR